MKLVKLAIMPRVSAENRRIPPFVQPENSLEREGITGRADQLPLTSSVLRAYEDKGPNSSGLFDLFENRPILSSSAE